jgi:hypothetical protein
MIPILYSQFLAVSSHIQSLFYPKTGEDPSCYFCIADPWKLLYQILKTSLLGLIISTCPKVKFVCNRNFSLTILYCNNNNNNNNNNNINNMVLVCEQTIPTERLLHIGEGSANFCGYMGVTQSAWHPYSRILGFLDRSRYSSSNQLLSCSHEAEWAPFQTHYFSENVVAPGIEPGPLDL